MGAFVGVTERRNVCLFGGPEAASSDFWSSSGSFISSVADSQVKVVEQAGIVTGVQCWVAPPIGYFKINVDAGFVYNRGKYGAGLVCRNSVGSIVGAAACVSTIN
ncbi:hypothetical protein LWI28_013540 [Acer negundo]|uniref:RNase H type-1 domain-containing protein n=1 Tax=Acer negundo TaxID=4023 RepID=A0AAD5NVN7_ACENE|nr:hypothetical protein LWI28_013540 [Acer negundo]